MDRSPLDFPVHGISQARILEWVAVSFPRGSSHQGLNPHATVLSGLVRVKGMGIQIKAVRKLYLEADFT